MVCDVKIHQQRVLYREHKNDDFVLSQVATHIGHQEPLVAKVKQRKLVWFMVWPCDLAILSAKDSFMIPQWEIDAVDSFLYCVS